MERGSDLHSAREDEELKHDLQGTIRGNRPSRAEEWRDPEPPADDDPEPWLNSSTGSRRDIGGGSGRG